MNSSRIRIDPHAEESIREIEYAVKEKAPVPAGGDKLLMTG